MLGFSTLSNAFSAAIQYPAKWKQNHPKLTQAFKEAAICTGIVLGAVTAGVVVIGGAMLVLEACPILIIPMLMVFIPVGLGVVAKGYADEIRKDLTGHYKPRW